MAAAEVLAPREGWTGNADGCWPTTRHLTTAWDEADTRIRLRRIACAWLQSRGACAQVRSSCVFFAHSFVYVSRCWLCHFFSVRSRRPVLVLRWVLCAAAAGPACRTPGVDGSPSLPPPVQAVVVAPSCCKAPGGSDKPWGNRGPREGTTSRRKPIRHSDGAV